MARASQLGYLGTLVTPGFVVLWATLLLPRGTRALYRAVQSHSTARLFAQLLVLLSAAAVPVSAADLAFQRSGTGASPRALSCFSESGFYTSYYLFPGANSPA
jgi:hypothetical protein